MKWYLELQQFFNGLLGMLHDDNSGWSYKKVAIGLPIQLSICYGYYKYFNLDANIWIPLYPTILGMSFTFITASVIGAKIIDKKINNNLTNTNQDETTN